MPADAPREPVPQDTAEAQEARRRLLVTLLVVTLFVAHALFTSNGVVEDDAYIAFRYAKNLAAGAGLRFQPGPPVEGYSCFSWVVLGALLARIGLDPAAFLPLVGIACGAAAIVVVMGTARRLRGGATTLPFAEVLPGFFLAASPGLAHYAGSGLETSLFVLLVALAASGALEGRPRRAAIAAALAVLTRPEGPAVALLAIGAGTLRAPSTERRAWMRAALPVAATALVYALFKWRYFGTLLPNTALAKPPVLRDGLAYVGWGLIDPGPLLVLSLVLLARTRGRPAHLIFAFAGTAALIAVAAVEGGDWMPAGRFLLPALCVAALGLDIIPGAIASASRRARTIIGALGGAALLFYLYWSWADTRMLAAGAAEAAHYEPFRDELVQRMQKAGVTSVGTLDIGRIAHVAPDLRILDLGGLTDRDIARASGDYRSKRVDLDPALLEARAPDAFLFTSRKPPRRRGPNEPPEIELYYPVERDVAASPWFRERYRVRAVLPVRADYILCWYERAR